jgi:hypothetical protein
MTVGRSQCWNITERDGKPALTVVQEDGARPYVTGDGGPRILTAEEELRWIKFKHDLGLAR